MLLKLEVESFFQEESVPMFTSRRGRGKARLLALRSSKRPKGPNDPRHVLFDQEPEKLFMVCSAVVPCLIPLYGSSINRVNRAKILAAVVKVVHFSSAIMLETLLKVR